MSNNINNSNSGPVQQQLQLDLHYTPMGYPWETTDFIHPKHAENRNKKIDERKAMQESISMHQSSTSKRVKPFNLAASKTKNQYKRDLFDHIDILRDGLNLSQFAYEMKITFKKMTSNMEQYETYFSQHEKDVFRDHYVSKFIKGFKGN